MLENIEILENTSEQKQSALAALKELAPADIAIALNKHVVFKSHQVE